MNLALSLAELMEMMAAEPEQALRDRWSQILGVPADSPAYFTAITITYGRMLELKSRIVEAASLPDRSKSVFGGAVDQLVYYTNPSRINEYATTHVRVRTR